MKRKKANGLVAALLAVMMLVMAPGCSRDVNSSSSSSSSSSSMSSQSSSVSSSSVSSSSEDTYIPEFSVPDLTEKVSECKAINKDVGGILYIPGTTIEEEPILESGPYGKLSSFLSVYESASGQSRRTWNDPEFVIGGRGVAYLQTTSTISSRSKLKYNTVIFGHNNGMPGLEAYDSSVTPGDYPDGIHFAQLFKFLDVEFASQNPYMVFSTEKENYVFQIFAVYYTDEETTPKYYSSNLSEEDAYTVAQNAIAKSELIYEDVEIVPGDKFITLSTCTYAFSTDVHTPYRFVISGKLMEEGAILPETTTVSKNPSPVKPAGM